MTFPSTAFALPEEKIPASIQVIVFDQDPVSRHVLSASLSETSGIDVVAATDDAATIDPRGRTGQIVVISAVHDQAVRAARLFAASGRRVLCLGVGWTRERLDQMFQANVHGCLVKETSVHPLVAAVRAVAYGCIVLSDELRDLRSGTARMSRLPPSSASPADLASTRHSVGALTDRELEVLELLASGWSTAEVATRLSVSRATVKSHVSHTLAKLGVRNRLEAVLLVRRLLDRHATSLDLLTRSPASA